MNKIETLNSSGVKEATLYFDKRDDGLKVKYCHGRMDWYRADNRYFIDVENYKYWD